MSKAKIYGKVRPCIRNNKADLRWLRMAVRKKRPREWRGAGREKQEART